MKTIISTLALCASLAIAQDIDFAAYEAVPILPNKAAPVGDTAPTPSIYNAASVASAAVNAVIAEPTGALAAVQSRKRSEEILEKRAACAARAGGIPAYAVNNPDTDTAFTSSTTLASAASNAVTPVGYSSIFTNGAYVAEDSTYLTYTLLESYDTNACASYCQSWSGCNTFNIYFERDATVEPGAGCDNPASLTYVKCALFGSALNSKAATGSGQWQDNFHVVVAGSNLYVATAPQDPSGFVGPTSLGSATIQAPGNTYMGVQTFPQSQPYDPSVCAAACDAKSAFDIQQGLPSASKPDICQFFVAYILYDNGVNGVFTCTYYTSAWDKSYATNVGQYNSNGDHFTIGYAYSFAKPNAPQNGAVAAASSTTTSATTMSTVTTSSTTSSAPVCSPTITDSILTNTGFEQGLASWSYSNAAAFSIAPAAREGCQSLELSPSGASQYTFTSSSAYLGSNGGSGSFYVGRLAGQSGTSTPTVAVTFAGSRALYQSTVSGRGSITGTNGSQWQAISFNFPSYAVSQPGGQLVVTVTFSGSDVADTTPILFDGFDLHQ